MIENDLDLTRLNRFLDVFVLLGTKEQRWLMSALARKADSLNRKRVTRQVNLDGSKYKGRKNAAKKKMFLKLKQRKNIAITIDGPEATLQHKGIMARTAYEHHYGVKLPKAYRNLSATIGRGRRHRVAGSDPCTPQQAGILISFVVLNQEGLEPETRVSYKELKAAEAGERSGRDKRNVVIRLFQDAYTAAEAGNTIARWDQAVSRRKGSNSPYYQLPSRHLLGMSNQDLPEFLDFAEERVLHYLKRSS